MMTKDELWRSLQRWATHDYLSRCCGSIPGEKERHEAIRQEVFDLILAALSPGPNQRVVPVELLERCIRQLELCLPEWKAPCWRAEISELVADLRAVLETNDKQSGGTR